MILYGLPQNQSKHFRTGPCPPVRAASKYIQPNRNHTYKHIHFQAIISYLKCERSRCRGTYSQVRSGDKAVFVFVFRRVKCGSAGLLNESTDGCLSTVVLACLGFLSPANRGALMTCAVVLWVLLGTPAGYVSARLYKSKAWRTSLTFSQSLQCFFDVILIRPALSVHSIWRRKVEDKRVVDGAVVPGVGQLAPFAWLSFTCFIECRIDERLCITFLCGIVFPPLLVLCLRTSSSWIWSCGWRAPRQQSRSAPWWPFWLCGLEFPCLSPLSVPTLDSRNTWVWRALGCEFIYLELCVE